MEILSSTWACCGRKVLTRLSRKGGVEGSSSVLNLLWCSAQVQAPRCFLVFLRGTNKIPRARNGRLLAKAHMVLSDREALETNGLPIQPS